MATRQLKHIVAFAVMGLCTIGVATAAFGPMAAIIVSFGAYWLARQRL